ncbi:MAG: FHA domain-containing protein [Candidatus Promineifilaceae bacterium]
MMRQLFLDFETYASERVEVSAETTIHNLCCLIADTFFREVSAEKLMLLTHYGDVLSNRQQTLRSRNIPDKARLFVLVSRREALSASPAWLREEEMGDVYPITWQPALIGRPGQLHDRELLAANLEWLPDAVTISRNHALILEREGVFYIQHLAGIRNETRLNGRLLAPDVLQRLQHNDYIILGPRQITIRFLLQDPLGLLNTYS